MDTWIGDMINVQQLATQGHQCLPPLRGLLQFMPCCPALWVPLEKVAIAMHCRLLHGLRIVQTHTQQAWPSERAKMCTEATPLCPAAGGSS